MLVAYLRLAAHARASGASATQPWAALCACARGGVLAEEDAAVEGEAQQERLRGSEHAADHDVRDRAKVALQRVALALRLPTRRVGGMQQGDTAQ